MGFRAKPQKLFATTTVHDTQITIWTEVAYIYVNIQGLEHHCATMLDGTKDPVKIITWHRILLIKYTKFSFALQNPIGSSVLGEMVSKHYVLSRMWGKGAIIPHF